MQLNLGIVDYGAGNFESVRRALRSIGVEAQRISRREDVRADSQLSHLIVPGVGRASQAMRALKERGLEALIRDHMAAGRPLLGICVGMQILGMWSEEDDTPGLGVLDFKLKRLRVADPVPHMGWNSVTFSPDHESVTAGRFTSFSSLSEEESAHFYFVHSFAALVEDVAADLRLGLTSYAGVSFVSVVGKRNILGCQFHIEKSGRAGQELLRSFLEMQRC